MKYKEQFLSNVIKIGIYEGDEDEQSEIKRRIDAAISIINSNGGVYDPEDKSIIEALKGITVKDIPRTGLSSSGIYNMRSNYILSNNATWLGSTMAHDSYHYYQRRMGQVYKKKNARWIWSGPPTFFK